jgi:hypothetical protein
VARILTFEHGVNTGIAIGAYIAFEFERRTANSAVDVSEETNPLIPLLGKYQHEPLWDGFEEALRRIHEEELAHG